MNFIVEILWRFIVGVLWEFLEFVFLFIAEKTIVLYQWAMKIMDKITTIKAPNEPKERLPTEEPKEQK